MKHYCHPELTLLAVPDADILTLSASGRNGDALTLSYEELSFQSLQD